MKFGISAVALLVSWKILTDEVEEGMNVMGPRPGLQWPETGRNGGGLHWKPRFATDCIASGGGGGGSDL
jgi:hypothetical protein